MIYTELLKKYLWVVDVIFVIVAGALAAIIVNTSIAAKIDVMPTVDFSPKSADTLSANPSVEDFNVILERNVFNSASVLRDILSKMASKVGLEVSPGDLELIGTVAGPPEISLALISTKTDGKVNIYRIKDEVGDYMVERIDRGRVTLSKDGKEEILKLPDIKLASLFSASTSGDGIRGEGGDEFVVDQRIIDDGFENMGKLMRQARIVPHMKDGQIDGFKVYRIKDNSLYKKIGLKNGDIINRVNGIEIHGPEDGLRLFEVFKSSKTITMDLTRGKEKKTLTYSIR